MSDLEVLFEALLDLDRPLLIALDVDGTISTIVRDPDEATIAEPALEALQSLARSAEAIVALITGRDLDSLSRMERLDGIWRAVEHGGLVLAPGEKPPPRELSPAERASLERFRDWAGERAQDAFIEHKPQAVAVHVRAIAAREPARARALLEEAEALAGELGLHVRRGKALREAEVAHYDKASALREIAERSRAKSVFFAGDDLTDFAAIELAAMLGVGAFVWSDERRGTPPPSSVRIRNVSETTELLARHARQLGA